MTEYGPGTGEPADGRTPTDGDAPDPARSGAHAPTAGHADGDRTQEAQTPVTEAEQHQGGRTVPTPRPWATSSNPSIPAHGSGYPPTSVYPPLPQQGPPPRPPRRYGTGALALALVAGLIGGGVGFGGAYALLDGSDGTAAARLTSAAAPGIAAKPADGSTAGAAAAIIPSTVDIQVRTAQGEVEGSGVVLTADGDVLTNNHVVSGARNGGTTVSTSDGRQFQAQVVGTSPSYDLAVIRLQRATDLKAATLGESAGVQVGEQVVATGSPQGLSGTVTSGIISALNRTVAAVGEGGGSPVVYNGLQTDAPINHGNSGGPLVNLAGQVVGINSTIATSGQGSGSIGLGFAIPVDTAKRVAQELMSGGVANKPQLGVQGTVSATGSGPGVSSEGGAQVAAVEPGSPAAAAGIKTGDVVTRVDDYSVANFADLIARVGNFAPGQQVKLTVGSGSGARQVPLTLGSVQDTEAANAQNGSFPAPGGSGPSDGDQGGAAPFGINPFGGGN